MPLDSDGRPAASTSKRKAYSCTSCRQKKIRCDRRQPCSHCKRKEIRCIWPGNGVYLASGTGRPLPYAPCNPRPAVSPPGLHRPQRRSSGEGPSTSIAPPSPARSIEPTHGIEVEALRSVATAETFDHSILNRGPTPPPHQDDRATLGWLPRLPSRSVCDQLMRYYLDLADWIHHPIHLPTLLGIYNRLWDTDDWSKTVPARWLALLYAVLCLGAHFGGMRSLFSIQTIITLNVYLNNSDRKTRASSYLAIAIKMAIELGLSRVPSEDDVEHETSNVVQRETGRRLWWSLVCQDAYTSSASGFSHSINLHHATTGVPTNVDDEDVVDGQPLVAHPFETLTSATMHIYKIGFALVVRRFVDAINSAYLSPPYEVILKLDKEFRTVLEETPPGLRHDLPQPVTLRGAASRPYSIQQRLFTGITLHNRLVRLHRAYMVRGYTDPVYAYSTWACLESAHALLNLVWDSRRQLLVWWVVIVHVWTSGLVVAVDLFHATLGSDTSKQRKAILVAMELLSTSSSRSPVASRGVEVLQGLLRKFDETNAETPRPHGTDEDKTSNLGDSDGLSIEDWLQEHTRSDNVEQVDWGVLLQLPEI